MKFWDSIRERWLPGYDERANVRIAKAGERLESLVASGSFDVMIEEILDPMEQEAFEAFKKLDPQSAMEVMQTQKMAQIVSEIKRRVEKKIEAGLSARQTLLDNSNPKEGE